MDRRHKEIQTFTLESPFFILNGNFGVQIGIVFLSPFVHLQIILLPSSLTKKKKKKKSQENLVSVRHAALVSWSQRPALGFLSHHPHDSFIWC